MSPDEWTLGKGFGGTLGEIRWDRLGDPDAEPVVLVHGTPFSSFIWRDVARALAAARSVYVFDMPGYGASSMADGQDLSLDALAGAFAELLEHWGLARPDVVAHDSGGAVALGAHVDRGVAYRRLALVDAVSLPPWGSEFFAVVGEHAGVFRSLPGPLHRALLREYVATASSPGLHPDVLDALTAPWLGAAGQDAFYRQLVQRRDDPSYIDRIRTGYTAIDLPVLVCWGADDGWVPADRGRELAALVPGAGLRVIGEAGHLLPEDRPAQLTAALLGFLAS
ncbi:alpha/beta fold hydrolase [Actinomadura madurae]|uniref:alpha/beta fold hydrolase n=1 Tax=Actinomadura madurae TaxID=1993 RepID=UPI0020D25A3D|nr:alpha/beta fold hydrolase [Actinomadura madurae]MCP9954225.1 alpha/beta fold hydrolase [Actinomadura madurae]MCP9970983.1 alpha/beta fold hydrolase [Actinomadura madurae]MCP9983461.1 alpha/beta fold hydrolase [Actinomadura madurae]MCQ0004975.1 alpha/beta fold hydrolase [Actinomadura madurae]MCQ0019701.1 alpha/beta fold hydrolase [Actinomadura madurae]